MGLTPSRVGWLTAAPAPPPVVHSGTVYDGRARGFAYATTLAVDKQGRLDGYAIQFEDGRCSDGGRYGGDDDGSRRVPISADGRATVSQQVGRAYSFTRTGRLEFGASIEFFEPDGTTYTPCTSGTDLHGNGPHVSDFFT